LTAPEENFYKKIVFFHFWLLASSQKKLAYARKQRLCPSLGPGGCSPLHLLARTAMAADVCNVLTSPAN